MVDFPPDIRCYGIITLDGLWLCVQKTALQMEREREREIKEGEEELTEGTAEYSLSSPRVSINGSRDSSISSPSTPIVFSFFLFISRRVPDYHHIGSNTREPISSK